MEADVEVEVVEEKKPGKTRRAIQITLRTAKAAPVENFLYPQKELMPVVDEVEDEVDVAVEKEDQNGLKGSGPKLLWDSLYLSNLSSP